MTREYLQGNRVISLDDNDRDEQGVTWYPDRVLSPLPVPNIFNVKGFTDTIWDEDENPASRFVIRFGPWGNHRYFYGLTQAEAIHFFLRSFGVKEVWGRDTDGNELYLSNCHWGKNGSSVIQATGYTEDGDLYILGFDNINWEDTLPFPLLGGGYV